MAATPADVSAIGAALRSQQVKEADVDKLHLIEEQTSDVATTQERVLEEILAGNAGAEYLSKCALDDAGDDTDRAAAFRAKVPVESYDDLRPYIQRVADGDRSPVLSTRPITEFFTSSGTSSGAPKLMPIVKDDTDRRQALHCLVTPILNLFVSGLDKGKRLYFLFAKTETKTRGGITARAALTSMYKSERFKNLAAAAYTSPAAAILCAEASQSMYAQMVCGLCHRHDVLSVGAAFAPALLRAIRLLQLDWEQLAADVEAGELHPRRVTDQSVHEAVAGVLRRPDPELAGFIRAECCNGDWAGIIRRIWPNTKYLSAVVTGAMAQYVPTLQYYGGGLSIVSSIYASSECFFGLNLRPMCDPSEVLYTFVPNMSYLEFLPGDALSAYDSDDVSDLVDLAGVEVGREYEAVVTTYAGMSRYRVGDVLRVMGFHNAAPQFRFVRRRDALLSVDSDKTDEAELQRAVERASALLLRARGASIAEFTGRVCTDRIPGHYVVYWELLPLPTVASTGVAATMVNGEDDTLGRCCLEMEEALGAVYRRGRVVDGAIGPLEIWVVDELMDAAVSGGGGASIGQYMVPRCMTLPRMVELLDARVVSNHFSPTLPHWTPLHDSFETHKFYRFL